MLRSNRAIVSLGIALGALYATSAFVDEIRILCEKFGPSRGPLVAPGLFCAGFALGVAIGCVLSPRLFLEAEGRQWLYITRTRSVVGLRVKCVLLILSILAFSAQLWWTAFVAR